MQDAYLKSGLNGQIFSKVRVHLDEFFESEKCFLTKEFIQPGMKILDVGGGGLR